MPHTDSIVSGAVTSLADTAPLSPSEQAHATRASDDAAVHWVKVVLDVPLPGPFDYRSEIAVSIGTRVIVSFGRRQLIGVVVGHADAPGVAPDTVRAVERILDDLPPFTAQWLKLTRFAADYYQRPWGEVILPALPPALRKPSAYVGARSAAGPIVRLDKRRARPIVDVAADVAPELNEQQALAVATLRELEGFAPVLLHGVTGSGKTEVYMHAAADILARGRQVLLLVPEINLTPQLEASLRRRLEHVVGPQAVAVMHSGLSDGERLASWVGAQRGDVRMLLGTRMAIFAPMAELGLIVVDEEHEASYKQQDGLRYSARDLAVWRAHDAGIPIILGSATPSLETWQQAERGRYRRLTLQARARASTLPTVKLIDTRRAALKQGFSDQLITAIGKRLEAGEQSLVFINRRGYSPVLQCTHCAWVSSCPRCTAYTVLHRFSGGSHRLQCHHCGFQSRVPRACPECGDQDLQPMGRGTQRVEEHLAEIFPGARISRIDADTTRRKGSAQALFDQVHAGDVDILVGTQMVAKGHDFARLGLVGVLNADAMLFAHDFRAPERLFAQLMQVGGRAGRHAGNGEVLVQTGYPDQFIYQALVRDDYVGFARHALKEREETGLPPFAFQALLTAEARELPQAIGFLQQARALATSPEHACGTYGDHITLYDPVPLRVVRVANVERAQLLIEAQHRPALQAFLTAWNDALPALASTCRVRWQLEVDPLEI